MWRRLLSVLGCLPHLLIRSATDCIAKTQVIMAGLDNIDPAVLCRDDGAARARKARLHWQAIRFPILSTSAKRGLNEGILVVEDDARRQVAGVVARVALLTS